MDNVANALDQMSIGMDITEETYTCDVCGAKYKKPWTLKTHQKKKHGKVEDTTKGRLTKQPLIWIICYINPHPFWKLYGSINPLWPRDLHCRKASKMGEDLYSK